MRVRSQGHKDTRTHVGFTLVEVLVTVAVLAFGLVAIYEGLFVAMDAFGIYQHRLMTQDWINERLWEKQDELLRTAVLSGGGQRGSFRRKGKEFTWSTQVAPLDSKSKLYRITVALSWQEGKKAAQVLRGTYVLDPQPIEE